jgi:lysophospholipase L1-like esterase
LELSEGFFCEKMQKLGYNFIMSTPQKQFFFLVLCISSLWFPSCRSFPEPQLGKTVILAIGDSITQGDMAQGANETLSNTISGGWVSLLGQGMEESYPGQDQVVNLGINGDTVLGVQARLEKALDGYQPEMVILGIGTNDILWR